MEEKAVRIFPLGDRALVVEFSLEIDDTAYERIQGMVHSLEATPFPGFFECVPAYTTLTVYYDPYVYLHKPDPLQEVSAFLWWHLRNSKTYQVPQVQPIPIPVCYGGEFGPDLLEVAAYHNLSAEEVIALHSGGDYRVYMIGFTPGFPYIGGMSSQLASPRRSTPHLKIPAGSVGIGGKQTGIYPLESPGGWRIIGRTPVNLFNPYESPPVFLQGGNRVSFVPITPEEFKELQQKEGKA